MTALSPRRSDAGGSIRLVDVAQLAGVSLKTASRVMNGAPAVSDGVRERVQTAARQLNYVPNLPARRLSSGRTNVFAFVAAELNSGYAARVVNSFVVSAEEAGYRTMLFNSHRDTERDLSIVASLVHGHEVDGLVFFRSAADEPALEAAASQVPIVLIDPHRVQPRNVAHVVVDNDAGVRVAVEHLARLGHRRIGHLTYHREASLWIDVRGAAYHAAMADLGLLVSDDLVIWADSRDDLGRAALARFQKPDPPTALFAVSDYAGVSAINALEGAGIRVPADVSIVGFDDGPLAEACRPALTAVRQPMALLAETAVVLLLGMVEGRPPGVRTVLPVQLIERASTAQRSGARQIASFIRGDAAAE